MDRAGCDPIELHQREFKIGTEEAHESDYRYMDEWANPARRGWRLARRLPSEDRAARIGRLRRGSGGGLVERPGRGGRLVEMVRLARAAGIHGGRRSGHDGL